MAAGFLKSIKVLAAVLLAIGFSGITAYAVMSDTSVHGLTVKMFSISRSCPVDPSTNRSTVNFSISSAVWSSSSLRTSITNVRFTLTVDGALVGTVKLSDATWNPGESAGYHLNFEDPALNPLSLPSTSKFVLSLTADVTAGMSSTSLTTTDSLVQDFGTTSC